MSEVRTIEETLNYAINKLIGMTNIHDMQKAFSKVDDEQKEFLTLKCIKRLSNKEILKVTGKSIGALRIMQFKALKILKALSGDGQK